MTILNPELSGYGVYGGRVLNGTTEISGTFARIDVAAAATFTVLSGSVNSGSGFAFPAGTTLRGEFTNVKLSGGTVIVYNGK